MVRRLRSSDVNHYVDFWRELRQRLTEFFRVRTPLGSSVARELTAAPARLIAVSPAEHCRRLLTAAKRRSSVQIREAAGSRTDRAVTDWRCRCEPTAGADRPHDVFWRLRCRWLAWTTRWISVVFSWIELSRSVGVRWRFCCCLAMQAHFDSVMWAC